MSPEPEGAGWESEVVAISSEAGGLVRDQIRALLGRARQRADAIEREAQVEAEALRARSRHAARTVLESVEAIDLGLQAHVDELRRASQEAEESAAPPELIAASEAVHAQADLLRTGLASQQGEAPPAAASPPAPLHARMPGEEENLAAQARRRAAVADDATLIDMYSNAERQGAAGDDEFWATLKRAVIAEAGRREDFAAQLDAGEGLKRGQRKERKRALDAIRAALADSAADQA